MRNPGLLVKVKKDGRIGRTYNSKKPVYGKIVVYLQKDKKKHQYETGGTLFNAEDLQIIGHVD